MYVFSEKVARKTVCEAAELVNVCAREALERCTYRLL
jgi:hypothetical protein